MDQSEARTILHEHLGKYRQRSYADLAGNVDKEDRFEAKGPSGTVYYLQFLFVWDSAPNADIRVIGHIDDGGWRAFCPLTEDFILSPSGVFVGE